LLQTYTLNFIYNITTAILQFILRILALFNKKIEKGVKGRLQTFQLLNNTIEIGDKTLWFHCASLGEYEQGLPVFKALRNHYSKHKIVLTFFSPSGYDIRKNTPVADIVVYLPIDTIQNAKRFLNIVNPELTIFVKYDLWPNFLNELKNRNLRAILISALFRKKQAYFKWYGFELRKILFAFEHIFTQNEASKYLLNSINYYNVTVSGDTRFDRVTDQLSQNNRLDFIENFKQNQLCVVAGSTWPEDEVLFLNYINSENNKDTKFIIAPHNIKPAQIKNFQEKLKTSSILYSEKKGKNHTSAQVFIIDTIGLLSKIYSYADVAYVGGAKGNTGLHNTLEPAVFGVPIIIGENYLKFPEAITMIANHGMFSISTQKEFNTILNDLILHKEKRILSGHKNLDYIKSNKGAVSEILHYLESIK